MKLNYTFEFDSVKHDHPLTPGEKENCQIKERPLVCPWAEENIYLVERAYMYPGPFRAYPWQVEVINSFNYWDRICCAGAVQTMKSGMTDLMMYYAMCVLSMNGMLAYANDDKSVDCFEDRIRLMFRSEQNPCLRKLWDGKEDSLTSKKMTLINCIWRTASANNPNSLASSSAPISIGSEVAKWQKKSYDPVSMLRGRMDSMFVSGTRKSIIESSPFEPGDYLYKEFFRAGSIILRPHYKCPHCGCWQVFIDSQVLLRDQGVEHAPAKIRADKSEAVFYQCIGCKQEITESQRAVMAAHVVWAAPEIDIQGFKQAAEKIYTDGTIPGRLEGGVRYGYDTVCYQWNRFVDVAFPFWECLARHFESVRDNEKKKVYENETMGRWWAPKTKRLEVAHFESRKQEYYQWGPAHTIPDDVLVLTYGGDTQDDGFFYSLVGWGYGMTWWVVRHDFIPCRYIDDGDKAAVYAKFSEEFYREPLKWPDGSTAMIKKGLQDRGGHRAKDVDYLCQKIPNISPYIGLNKVYSDREVIYKSPNGEFYLGQSEVLSKETGIIIAGENFWLPADTNNEFTQQIIRQFFIKERGTRGVESEKWVHGYQGPDHFRDTLNLAFAAGMLLKLKDILYDRTTCDLLKSQRCKFTVESVRQQQTKPAARPATRAGQADYFSRAYGRR